MIPLNVVNTRNRDFHDVICFIPETNNRLVSDVAVRMERMVFYNTLHAGKSFKQLLSSAVFFGFFT